MLSVSIKPIKDNRVHIIHEFKYLTSHNKQNKVYWSDRIDVETCIEWIVELQDGYIFIRTAAERYNMTLYLGAPNKNKEIYLYTQKNHYTRWSIELTEVQDIFNLKYIGDTFDINKLIIIVARYEEDVQWAQAYSDICIIYNKGQSTVHGMQYTGSLPNLGREAHTYLLYMISSYEYLSENIVFTQADPFPHNPTILCAIDSIEKTDPIQPLGYIYSETTPSKELVDKAVKITDYSLKYICSQINRNLQTVGPVAFDDTGINKFIVDHQFIYPDQAHKTMIDAFLERCKFPINMISCDSRIPFTYSGLFKVTKDIIRKYSKDVYINMINELILIHPQGGLNGYILERLWIFLFGYKYIL